MQHSYISSHLHDIDAKQCKQTVVEDALMFYMNKSCKNSFLVLLPLSPDINALLLRSLSSKHQQSLIILITDDNTAHNLLEVESKNSEVQKYKEVFRRRSIKLHKMEVQLNCTTVSHLNKSRLQCLHSISVRKGQ